MGVTLMSDERLDRLELDPRILIDLKDVRDRVEEAMGRLSLLELELERYIGGPKQ
jgi:hypothetical protein